MKTIEWAAGLFEGEGCIYTGRQSRAPHNIYHQLTLTMSDEDVVEDFHKVVGCGTVKLEDKNNPKWKPLYRWRVSKTSDVENILEKMLPYFGQRRAYKALNCLDDIDNI